MKYQDTHRFFAIDIHWDHSSKSWPIVEMCRQSLGDNNITQALQNRPWFTTYNGVWIRHDCLTDSLASWLVLKSKT